MLLEVEYFEHLASNVEKGGSTERCGAVQNPRSVSGENVGRGGS